MQSMHTWLTSFILHTDTLMSVTVIQHQCMYGINYIKYITKQESEIQHHCLLH